MRAARGHRLAAGDVVITRQNTIDVDTYTDHTLATAADPIRNGQRWEVHLVDPERNRIGIRRLDDGALATLAGDYLRQQVHLGYAVTVHAAQDVTADTCHTLPSSSSRTPPPPTPRISRPWPPPWSPPTAGSCSSTAARPGTADDSSTDLTCRGMKSHPLQRISTIQCWPATADRHRAEAARSWRIRTNPPTRDRSRDRDRGHGLDID